MKKFYITNGTFDFMKKFYYKNKEKHNLFLLLDGQKQDVTLFHESNQKTVFGNPRKYEVLQELGDFIQSGVIMIKHITVEKEDQAYFESRFESYVNQASLLRGLVSYRFLRPEKGIDYIVLTAWTKEIYAEMWEIPSEFFIPSSQVLHGDFFAVPTYTKKYWAPSDEEIEERFE
jgi:hypothetical protein